MFKNACLSSFRVPLDLVSSLMRLELDCFNPAVYKWQIYWIKPSLHNTIYSCYFTTGTSATCFGLIWPSSGLQRLVSIKEHNVAVPMGSHGLNCLPTHDLSTTHHQLAVLKFYYRDNCEFFRQHYGTRSSTPVINSAHTLTHKSNPIIQADNVIKTWTKKKKLRRN